MIFSRQVLVFISALAFSSVTMLSISTLAHTASISCSKLINEAGNSVQTPKVVIDNWKGIVTITGSSDTCREPIEVWSSRSIIGYPTTHITSKPNPQIKINTPDLSTRSKQVVSNTSDKLFSTNRKDQQKMSIGGPLVTRCEIELRDIWKEGLYKIENIPYYLVRIFTIDNNHDGITDNVGFVFQKSGQPELKAYHNPLTGHLRISSVENFHTLKVSEIALICFGQVKFNVPEEKIRAQKLSEKAQIFKIPDITQEIEDKVAGNLTAKEIIANKIIEGGENTVLWIWLSIAIGVFVIFGSVLFLLTWKGKIPSLRRIKKRSQKDFDPSSTADADEDNKEGS